MPISFVLLLAVLPWSPALPQLPASPTTPPPPAGQKPASNVIDQAHNGCVLIENWVAPGQTGQSFNLYDRTSKRWHQTWVDSTGGRHEYWDELKGGNMVFAGEIPLGPGSRFAGRRVVRLTFFPMGPSDADSYLRQRLVFEHVSREAAADRLFVEEAVLSVLGAVTHLAYERDGRVAVRLKRRRGDVDAVEAARDLIARRYCDNLSLSEIARAVETSVYHLSRVFHARTGFSLHAYRNQLRLRAALERLADRDVELTGLALDLGFSSHSHFTETFRRTFGRTPSSVRRSL